MEKNVIRFFNNFFKFYFNKLDMTSNLFGLNKNGIRELKESDFKNDHIINFKFKFKNGLVVFYHPNDPKSISLIPILIQLNSEYEHKQFIFATVNGKEWTILLKRFNIYSIDNFPTIFYVKRNGFLDRYESNELTIDNIRNFIKDEFELENTIDLNNKLEKEEKLKEKQQHRADLKIIKNIEKNTIEKKSKPSKYRTKEIKKYVFQKRNLKI
jgi:thioredoxin-like negative regulator of GroEL